MDALEAVSAAVAELAPWLGPIEKSVYLPGGYSNDNYRITVDGEDYALRLCRKQPAAAERTFLTLEIAPDVVAYDAEHGHMVTRWIEGALVVEQPLSVVSAAEYLKALHWLIPTRVSRYDVAATIRRDLASGEGQQSAYHLLETIDWQAASIAGCHNDLNPWNIIQTGDGLRTLDWEYAGDNDPVFDLVGFAHGAGFDIDATTALKNAYDPSISAEHLIRTIAIFQLREHAWAVRQIAAGNDRPEIVEQRDSCIRLAEATSRRLVDIDR